MEDMLSHSLLQNPGQELLGSFHAVWQVIILNTAEITQCKIALR